MVKMEHYDKKVHVKDPDFKIVYVPPVLHFNGDSTRVKMDWEA